MKVYFYKINNIKKCSNYKRYWSEQIFNGIKNYLNKIIIVNNILKANIIFTIVDFVEEIENKIKLNELKIKLIIINCGDTIIINKNILLNPNILYIFDHLKLKYIPNNLLLTHKSYSKYFLNNCHNKYNNIITQDDNLKNIYLKNIYLKKTKAILNTSKLYSKLFNNKVSTIHDRIIDIAFIGTINYDCEPISSYRKDIVTRLKELRKKHNLNIYLGNNDDGNKMKLNDYYRILKKTKIFISPWGYGEWSLKEFECICFGVHCMIPTKNLINYPNFYENFDDYNNDFSDFETKLLLLLNNLDQTQEKINKNHKLFLEYSHEKQIKNIENLLLQN